jgi:hypothetical protein
MKYEIKIVGDDDYEYNIDEIEMITISNKLGNTFQFKPEEIKSIELVTLLEPLLNSEKKQ